jgi:putative aldouronate transport system substrate-binding protein
MIMKTRLFQLLAVLALTAAVSAPVFDADAQDLVTLNIGAYPAVPELGDPPEDWEMARLAREQLNIDIQLLRTPGGDDGLARLNALAAANDLPDVIEFRDRNQFFTFASQGLLAEATPLLQYMPNRTAARYSDPALNALVSLDGTMYGLQEPAIVSRRLALFIRQDWLDNLGLTAPTTLDEFMEVARAFTEDDPDGNGQDDTYGFGAYEGNRLGLGGNSDRFAIFFGAFGVVGRWDVSSAESIGLQVRKPAMQQAIDALRQVAEANVMDPDWPVLNLDEFRSRWKQGKYGMFVEDFAAAMVGNNYQPFDVNFPEGELRVIQPPAGPDGQYSIGTHDEIGLVLAISQRAVDEGKAEAIGRFLDWMLTDEGYRASVFGIEGQTYLLDADGNPTNVGLTVDQQNLQGAQTQLKWWAVNGSPAELNARYIPFTTINGREIVPLEILDAAHELGGWVRDTPTAMIPAAPNQADIDRYISENLIQFVLGQKPLDDQNWGEFIDGLDSVGVGDWEANAREILTNANLLP